METTTQSIAEARYYARKGYHFSHQDAEIIGPELVRLAHEGKSSAEGILEDARENEDSPLRRYFTWDDSIAAHQHRLHEARKMAQAIEIEIVSGDNVERMREFFPIEVVVSDNGDSRTEVQYTPIEIVRDTPSHAEQVVRRFERDALALHRRNRILFSIPEFQSSAFRRVLEVLEEAAEEHENGEEE